MTRQEAVGLMVTSPVISPTSWNSSYISLYFWLERALMGLVKITLCFSRRASAMAYLQETDSRLDPCNITVTQMKSLATNVSNGGAMLVHSLSTDSLASRGVCRHKHRLVVVNTQYGLTLERVQNKRVFLQDTSKQSGNDAGSGTPTKHKLYYMNFLCARQDLKCAQTLAAFPTRGFSGLY